MKAVVEGLLFISGNEGITVDKINENDYHYHKESIWNFWAEVNNKFQRGLQYA